MRIVGIVGSMRESGNTEHMVNACLEEARKSGAITEIILIRNLNLQFCDGCLRCDEAGNCHCGDGMNEVNEKLSQADGIVFGTPTRWRLLSGELKVFMDRTNPLAVPKRLKGKVAGIIAVGQTSGRNAASIIEAAESVRNYCKDNNMKIVGIVIGKNALKAGDIMRNRRALSDCRRLGKKMVSSIRKRETI